MRRRLFNIACVVSLLLSAATAGLAELTNCSCRTKSVRFDGWAVEMAAGHSELAFSWIIGSPEDFGRHRFLNPLGPQQTLTAEAMLNRMEGDSYTNTSSGLSFGSGPVEKLTYRNCYFIRTMHVESTEFVAGTVTRISHLHYCSACYLLPTVMFFLLPLGWLVGAVHHWHVRKSRKERGRCLDCGYDLMGNNTGICPECGVPQSVTQDTQTMKMLGHVFNILCGLWVVLCVSSMALWAWSYKFESPTWIAARGYAPGYMTVAPSVPIPFPVPARADEYVTLIRGNLERWEYLPWDQLWHCLYRVPIRLIVIIELALPVLWVLRPKRKCLRRKQPRRPVA